jgi:16S rRNA (cytosine967-C5)-methyltransferase
VNPSPPRPPSPFAAGIVRNQQKIFLRLLGELRPHLRRDPALPARLHTLLARHRSFGARDRRLYRELVFTTLRFLPWIEPCLDTAPEEAVRRVAWLAAETRDTHAFRAAFVTGEPPAGDRAGLLPGWFRAHCPELFSGEELAAQLRRAPLWLRLQTDDPQPVLDELDSLGWAWRRAAVLPNAIELRTEADVTKTAAWRSGRIEVQDLGSQLVLGALDLPRGGHWLDACAGAGGKTLQLASLLGPDATIDAYDIRAGALAELQTRATRAGFATRIRILTSPASDLYDGVLVDAPCSGSGTWRRAPHLKWVTTEETIRRAAAQQQALLAAAALRVRSGGRLVYATCSLSPWENENVVSAFLAANADFVPDVPVHDSVLEPRGAGLLIWPSRCDTDGFFVAPLRRK